MGYMHIENLYRPRAQRLLAFRELYALEKIHGTSAHVRWSVEAGGLGFHAGGAKQETFETCFDRDSLRVAFEEMGHARVTVYGEAYGGKMQRMGKMYGSDLRFVVFDVRVGETWLAVPDACDVSQRLGLDFVPYRLVNGTTYENMLKALDLVRDMPSEQAAKCGITEPRLREGIVIRPPFEVSYSDGQRAIAKHKSEAFSERVNTPKVSKEAVEVLRQAEAIANEWVTPMRLQHVLDAIGATDLDPKRTGDVIKAMVEDVAREAEGEIELTRDSRKAIGTRTAQLYREAQLRGGRDEW